MPDPARTTTASRSAWLELRAELQVVNDGYEFLDEKRVLLAAEMLAQRDHYRAARDRFAALSARAAAALSAAAGEHGLDGLQVFPSGELQAARLQVETRPRIGQLMLEARLERGEPVAGHEPLRSTPQIRHCIDAFRDLLAAGAGLAAVAANLKRLTHEYRRTERRVRALENVVLPEIREEIAVMEEHLDLLDQEEVIRVRMTTRVQV